MQANAGRRATLLRLNFQQRRRRHAYPLVDPIIFGTIIDQFATGRAARSEHELVSGVLRLLALAVLVAVLSRVAKALQEYLTRLVVQKLGTGIFNDGLRHLLRLKF